MYQVDLDEVWGGRKRNCLGAGVSQVVDVAVVENVGGSSGGVAAERGSSPRVGPGGWRGSVVYERSPKRSQLSRPRRIGCCIAPGGTIHAHAARAAVGESPRRNCTLSRIEEEGSEGSRSTEAAPWPRCLRCLHRCVAAPQACILSTASAETKYWGEPVSQKGHGDVPQHGVRAAVYSHPSCEGYEVDRYDAARGVGPIFPLTEVQRAMGRSWLNRSWPSVLRKVTYQ